MLCWSTGLFEEPTELIGTGVAHLFAETGQEDTNFILRLWDETPGGARQLIASGYLKASHASSTRSAHRGEPLPPAPHGAVEPGKIEEYVLRLYPFAATFQPGHRLVVECRTMSRWLTCTTRCRRRMPSTCRWAARSLTRSTVTLRTPPGSCCRSRRSRRRTRHGQALRATMKETSSAVPDAAITTPAGVPPCPGGRPRPPLERYQVVPVSRRGRSIELAHREAVKLRPTVRRAAECDAPEECSVDCRLIQGVGKWCAMALVHGGMEAAVRRERLRTGWMSSAAPGETFCMHSDWR